MITTASRKNADYVRQLGADEVIDYRTENWAEKVQDLVSGGVNMVLDSLSGLASDMSVDVTAAGGTVVSLNDLADEKRAKNKDVHVTRLFVTPNGDDLRAIGALIENGELPIPPINRLPFKDAAKAQEQSRSGHVRGKLVLEIV
ncbi:hypothetical protein JCM17845_26610 [Iodidimonas gelatinilytica]|uniref:Uncharacterized protein n=1 Tax=Iodidimonas gelatinilytica TaxID=1236966 RepID=A0A5A7N1P3_9PROT|nr:zinc-binding dehydrogenase [Iodidimonas gelatinilytica]GER02038.1 hypothetical protein JCM17845_26610 [Iodidimonas gelatinilytica]